MFRAKKRNKKEKRKYRYYYVKCSLMVLYLLLKSLTVLSSLDLFPHCRRRSTFCYKNKTLIQSSLLTEFSLSSMATLRDKRKLAATSGEAPGKTRKSQSQNTLDPEVAQKYISQTSEESEGRVTRKHSKEFSRTESHILGALPKLDDFFLNPQVRTCSVAVPGTSRNSDSGNRKLNGDYS